MEMTVKQFMGLFDDQEFIVHYEGGRIFGSANAVNLIMGCAANKKVRFASRVRDLVEIFVDDN